MRTMKVPVHKTQSSFCVTEFVKHRCLPVDAVCMSTLHVLEHADPTLSCICKIMCPNVHETFCGCYMLCVCVFVCECVKRNGYSDYTVNHVNSDKQP